jgi:hypothetical protein
MAALVMQDGFVAKKTRRQKKPAPKALQRRAQKQNHHQSNRLTSLREGTFLYKSKTVKLLCDLQEESIRPIPPPTKEVLVGFNRITWKKDRQQRKALQAEPAPPAPRPRTQGNTPRGNITKTKRLQQEALVAVMKSVARQLQPDPDPTRADTVLQAESQQRISIGNANKPPSSMVSSTSSIHVVSEEERLRAELFSAQRQFKEQGGTAGQLKRKFLRSTVTPTLYLPPQQIAPTIRPKVTASTAAPTARPDPDFVLDEWDRRGDFDGSEYSQEHSQEHSQEFDADYDPLGRAYDPLRRAGEDWDFDASAQEEMSTQGVSKFAASMATSFCGDEHGEDERGDERDDERDVCEDVHDQAVFRRSLQLSRKGGVEEELMGGTEKGDEKGRENGREKGGETSKSKRCVRRGTFARARVRKSTAEGEGGRGAQVETKGAVSAGAVSAEAVSARAGHLRSQQAQRRAQKANVQRRDESPFTEPPSRPAELVTARHGFLADQDIPSLMRHTQRSRHELFGLWFRFKALCSLSGCGGGRGVDKPAFMRGVPVVAIEAADIDKIGSCFDEKDIDASGVLDWLQFVEAINQVEAVEYSLPATPQFDSRKSLESPSRNS